MSFDPACFDLAQIFLEDEPRLRARVKELAQAIQDAIEDWIETNRDDADATSDD